MKKKVMTIMVSLFILMCVFFVNLLIQAEASKSQVSPGLNQQQFLQPCPDKPNCMNSEYPDDKEHYSHAINIEGEDNKNVWLKAEKVIAELKGVVVKKNEQYLAATFTSDLLGFVDDFELRIDSESELLHFRSASRVGYGDMGVNMRRVLEFKKTFE